MLAIVDTTLMVFAAGLAADDVGDELLRCSTNEVRAQRLDSWDVDLIVNGDLLNLTCVSCDSSSMELIALLASGPAI